MKTLSLFLYDFCYNLWGDIICICSYIIKMHRRYSYSSLQEEIPRDYINRKGGINRVAIGWKFFVEFIS